MHVLELAARASARARRRSARAARSAGCDRRSPESSRCDCGRRTPGRRDRARARCPSSISPSSHGSTYVSTGDRSRGGVCISVMSRRPASDRCSVRGIGVAVSVSTSVCSLSCLSRSLCFTPKRCSSSTTISPRSRELDVGAEQPMRADDDVDLLRLQLGENRGLLFRRLKAAHRRDAIGKSARRSLNVRRC